jgi:hypothetical protein
MKKQLKPLMIFCQLLILCIFSFNVQAGNNAPFQIVIVHSNASTIAQVSVPNKQGHKGVVRVYNTQMQLVKEYNIELIASPYYSSIDISSLSKKQNYTIELTTDEGVVSSTTLSL